MSYDNTDRGALFKNDRKESERHPDYTGNINVAGQEFRLSAWIKEGKSGKFMSLSVQPKDGGAVKNGTLQPAGADLDDDIPF